MLCARAYRNTTHESIGEKPSYLSFGINLRCPTEAAFLSLPEPEWTNIDDYRENRVGDQVLIFFSLRRKKESFTNSPGPGKDHTGLWLVRTLM